MRDTASYATSGSSRYALAALLVGLTQADELSLSVNPWQIFAPQERRIWVPGAGAAVPDITAVYADSVTTSSVTPRVTLDFA